MSHKKDPKFLSIADSRRGSVESIVYEKLKKFDRLVSIFAKPILKRTKEEIDDILDAFETIQVFNDIKNQREEYDFRELLYHCYKKMIYEPHNKGEIIYHVGDPSNRIYIVLKGSVERFKRKSDEELKKELKEVQEYTYQNRHKAQGSFELIRHLEEIKLILEKKKSGNEHTKTKKNPQEIGRLLKRIKAMHSSLMAFDAFKNFPNEVEAFSIFSNYPDHCEEYFEGPFCKYKKEKVVSSGDSFGESALKNEVYRDEVIVANSDVHLVWIDKFDLKRTIEKVEKRLIAKWKLFKEFLSTDNHEIILAYSRVFKEKRYRLNEAIYCQGDQAHDVYLIADGEVQIVKSEGKEGSQHELSGQKKRQKAEKTVAKITPVTLFGEGEVFLNIPREYSAISQTDNALVYTCGGTEFKALKSRFIEQFRRLKDKSETGRSHWRRSSRSFRRDDDALSVLSHSHQTTESSRGDDAEGSVLKRFSRHFTSQENSSGHLSIASHGRSKSGDANDGQSQSKYMLSPPMAKRELQPSHFRSLSSQRLNSNHSEEITDNIIMIPSLPIADTKNKTEPKQFLLKLSAYEKASPTHVDKPVTMPYAEQDDDSFQHMVKQKLTLFEKKYEHEGHLKEKAPSPQQRPFEIDLEKKNKKSIEPKKSQSPEFPRKNSAKKRPNIAIDVSDRYAFKRKNKLSITGSNLKEPIKGDTSLDSDIEKDESIGDFQTPSKPTEESLTYRNLHTEPSNGNIMNKPQSPQMLTTLNSPKATIRDVQFDLATLELASPFNRKPRPFTMSVHSVRTLDALKMNKGIFKRPEILTYTSTNLKEIQVAPHSVRSDMAAAFMRTTMTSSKHNMFRIKPTRLHLAMKYQNRPPPLLNSHLILK